jgi:aryl-alcohol dehydrogenase-like predicted oxidoreductase
MTFSAGEGRWAAVGRMEQAAVNDVVKNSLERGVNFLDTANVYSEGRSEIMTGVALRQLGVPRDQFVLATKVLGRMGPGPNEVGLSRAHILSAVDASLKRLQLDHIDLYQIHGRDPLTPLEETLDALDACVRAGKVRYIGLCNLAAWEIAKALGISERRGWARFESVQAYYSIGGRDLEREIVPLANDQRLAILPWSPLAGGLLSGKFSRDKAGPEGARRTTFDFPPVDKERAFTIVDAMRPIAARHEVSVARVAPAATACHFDHHRRAHARAVARQPRGVRPQADGGGARRPRQGVGAHARVPGLDARADVGRSTGDDSERVVPLARLHGDPAQLRELVDRGLPAEAAVARALHAAKRHLRLVVHGGTVHVANARVDAPGDIECARQIATEDGRRQAVLGVVGERHGFIHRRDTRDRDLWAEGFVTEELHRGRDTIHHDALHDCAVALAARQHLGALRDRVRHQALHALDGGLPDH